MPLLVKRPFVTELAQSFLLFRILLLPLLLSSTNGLQLRHYLLSLGLASLVLVALLQLLLLQLELLLLFLALSGLPFQLSLEAPITVVKGLQGLEVFRGDLGLGFVELHMRLVRLLLQLRLFNRHLIQSFHHLLLFMHNLLQPVIQTDLRRRSGWPKLNIFLY